MIVDEIQSAIKSERAVFGFRNTIKFIKTGNPKTIVMANNLPDSMRKEIEHNAKTGSTKLEVFEGSSKELGVVCGKPFPVSTITIKA
jgi:large subunit ribosomal protein L30e